MKIIVGTLIIFLGFFFLWFGNVCERVWATNEKAAQLAANNKIVEAGQVIDSLRNEFIFWPLKTYSSLDPLESEKKLLYHKALLNIIIGQTEEAENVLRSLADVADGNLQLHSVYNFGNILLSKGEWKGAEKAYIDALKNQSADTDAKINLELLKKKEREKEKEMARFERKDAQLSERRGNLEFLDDFTNPKKPEPSKKIRW